MRKGEDRDIGGEDIVWTWVSSPWRHAGYLYRWGFLLYISYQVKYSVLNHVYKLADIGKG